MVPSAIPIAPEPCQAPSAPKFALPAGATDCHAHIYGAPGRHPVISDPVKLPPAAGLAEYRAMMAATGLERAVLVQPDHHGFDNGAMVEALVALGGAARGICALRLNAGLPLLRALDAAGVRAIRLTDLSSYCLGLRALGEAGSLAAGLGWHLSLLIDPAHLGAVVAGIDSVPCPVLVDHLARYRPDVSQPQEFEVLLRLAERPHVYVKLSAVEFLSRRPPRHADLDPLVARLAGVTDRLLWGTDWPHGSVTFSGAPMPDEGRLLDLLARWFPKAVDRRRILVDNPAHLYGFAADPQSGDA